MLLYFTGCHYRVSVLLASLFCLVLTIFLSLIHVQTILGFNILNNVVDNGNKSIHKQELDPLKSEDVKKEYQEPFHLSNLDNTAGNLQIPYSGLKTVGLSPILSSKLGLNPVTRGDVITHIISGSPAYDLGLRSLNLSKGGSPDEVVASRGDIILSVDGSTSFTTEYRDIEEYINDNKIVGDIITLSILRDGKPVEIEMRLQAKPMFYWYENRQEGIRIKYPSDWTIVNDSALTETSVVRFQLPRINPSLGFPAVIVSILKYPSSYYENSQSFDIGSTEDGDIIRMLNISRTTLGHLPAYSSLYYDYSHSDIARKVFTIFTNYDSELYGITFSVDPDKYENYLTQIKEMIHSFQFIR